MTGPPPTASDAMAMTRAILSGQPWPPPGVPDTPANKKLWQDIAADIEAMPGGVLPDVPADWTDLPDDTGPGQGPPPKTA